MNVEALSRYLSQAAQQPAALGRLDCVRFVVEALVIGWGRDYRRHLEYSDRRTAVAQLRRQGGLMDAIDRALGQNLPATDLGPGDIAYFDDPCIGIILPNHVLVKVRRCILRVPMDSVRCGWKT
jgi:hypothetical protein